MVNTHPLYHEIIRLRDACYRVGFRLSEVLSATEQGQRRVRLRMTSS